MNVSSVAKWKMLMGTLVIAIHFHTENRLSTALENEQQFPGLPYKFSTSLIFIHSSSALIIFWGLLLYLVLVQGYCEGCNSESRVHFHHYLSCTDTWVLLLSYSITLILSYLWGSWFVLTPWPAKARLRESTTASEASVDQEERQPWFEGS